MPSTSEDDPAHAGRAHPHDHGGCLCDHPPSEAEATPDHALPAAAGGVASAPAVPGGPTEAA